MRAWVWVAIVAALVNGEPPKGVSAGDALRLDIPARLQWREFNGYCGECSIQQAAMYYGTYVSQYICREIVNPSQRRQVLVGVNEGFVLDALRLKSEPFHVQLARPPQFESYMVWIKQHLAAGQPTIIVAYDQEGNDPDYDHIMLATGFTSRDSATYHPDDTLFFNDHFSLWTQRRPFRRLPDTRAMQGNGAVYEFCIPDEYDYGCAVTGIQDDSGAALPVQVFVDQPREPNLPLGEAPVLFRAEVTVGGLRRGQAYSLYRYNDYQNVPKDHYSKSPYDAVQRFVATQPTRRLTDQILSSSVAIYRCLPSEN